MFCINFGTPRVLQQITSTQLERTLVLLKERKKKMRRYGSYLQHYADRDMYYNLMGGPQGAMFVVERVPDRKNYIHHMSRHEQYHVRVLKKRNKQYDQAGAVLRHHQMWDGTHNSNNPLFDGALRFQYRGVTKDNAIAMFERWGVKGIVLDDTFKPNQGDVKYFKHRLYLHNFPWIRDPVTTSYKGDADWSWKGEDKIDYSNYGASTTDSRNDFTSLWREAVSKHGNPVVNAKPVVPESPKAAPAQAAKPTPTPADAPKTESPKAEPVAKADAKPAAAEPAKEKKEKKTKSSKSDKEAEKEANKKA